MALLPVAEALQRVLAQATALPAERVPITEAHGRVLAEDVRSLRTQPPADVSAMDGYAVRAEDVASVPISLKVTGEVAAGKPFAGTVEHGQAVRIFTGGEVPAGADTIVVQEQTKREGDSVIITVAPPKGRHIRTAGLDFRDGDVLLKRGRVLTGRDLGLAAAMNHPILPVYRKPRIALLATGDELVLPGRKPGPGQIVYSNGYAVAALARQEGAEVSDLGIARDTLPDTAAAIQDARRRKADVLVTMGGASVGDYDFVQQALAAEGMDLSFWKIAMRPGRPLMHGRLDGIHVLGLPGNPVSAFVCAFLFLTPLLRRLTGRSDVMHPVEHALLGCDLPENDERADYLRASLSRSPRGALVATPFALQDSSITRVLAEADCLVLREPHAPKAPAGSPCVILKLPL
ncbi:MAG: gephyrin-like molybdotransferase Glp [Pseudomonadota bacterium]